MNDHEVRLMPEMEERGFAYNDAKEWFERTWMTNNGEEAVLEVYKHFNSHSWRRF
ncbi:MAG: hypothetical protein AB8B32_04010 [Prochlorococcus sp.]|tara:strand:+ start:2950 stop:3114 length:165 start_codon:yes stop_codon:yes gene_type:complete